MDILGAAWDGGEFAWWENHVGDCSEWTKHSVAKGRAKATVVYAVDMDNDGDLDCVGAGYGLIDVWLNVGGRAVEWRLESVAAREDMTCVWPADLSGDQRPDVVGISWSDFDILWWETL